MKSIRHVSRPLFFIVLTFAMACSAWADQLSFSIQLAQSQQPGDGPSYIVNINLTSTNGPATYDEIISPNAAVEDIIGQNGGGYGTFFGDIPSMLDAVTNGLWTLIVNGGSANAETNYFTVSLSSDVTNAFESPTVTFPMDYAVGITNDPTFVWETLTNFTYLTVDAHDANYNVYTAASLPVDSTNWTAYTPLLEGLNYFDIDYTNGGNGEITVSTPTNALGIPQTNWSYVGGFSESQTVEFYVGAMSALAAHYTFDNSNYVTQDTSSNGFDLQGPTWFGPQPAYSADGVEGGALQFYASAWYNFSPFLLPVLASNFSVSVWLDTTNILGADSDPGYGDVGVFWMDNNYSSSNCIPLALTGTKAAFYTGDTGDTLHSISSITTGHYVHLVVTRNMATGEKRIYVNGELDNSDFGGTGLLNGSEYGYLAINLNDFWAYAGLMDDLQIYSTVLRPDQVSFLYDNPGQTVTNFGGGEMVNFNQALGTTNLNWLTYGDASWFVESTNTYDNDAYAVESSGVTNSQETVLQTTVTGPGTISFWWQSQANDGDFYVEFDLDSNYFDSIGGNQTWIQEQPFSIGPGTHELQWIAYADGSTNLADAGYVADVSYLAPVAPVITLNPTSQTNDAGYPVALTVAATGVPPPTYQWYSTTSGPIAGATNAFYIPADSGYPTVAGSYYAVASNAAGTATSTTAQVSFNYTLPPPDWSQAFKSPFYYQDYFLGSIADVNGNLYVAAQFAGTNYVGTNYLIAGSGGDAAAVVKYPPDSYGAQSWVEAITNAGAGSCYGLEVAAAPEDGVYFMGNLTGTNYLGLFPLIDSGGGSVFLARFDSNGLPLWAEVLGQTGSSFSELNCMASDSSGNVTVSGLYSGAVNIGGSNITFSGQAPCMASFDQNGNLLWQETSSGFVQDLVWSAGVLFGSMGNNSTNIVVGGLTNNNDREWTIVALNSSNGQGIWTRGIGSAFGDSNPNGVGDDVPRLGVSGSNVFAAGTAYGPDAEFGALSVQFSSPPGNYFARCDTNGVAQILSAFGSPSTRPFAAAADANGNVYVAGDFDGVSYFGSNSIAAPRLAEESPTDFSAAFLAKFDQNGDALWVREAQSLEAYVNFRGVAVAPGGVYASGFGDGSVEFGTQFTPSDTYILGTFGPILFRPGGMVGEVTEVGSAPVITSNPQSTTNLCGTDVTLDVRVSNIGPVTYQWYNGVNPIPGQNTAALYFDPASVDDSGNYSVVVLNAFGGVTSSVATVSVLDNIPPSVQLNGSSIVTLACPDTYVEAGATADSLCAGSLPVTISGTINPVAPSTNILYYVATDPYGLSTTNTRTVIIVPVTNPPSITLNGPNPMQVLVNTPFVDPGASAIDFCGSAVPVITNGTVNTAEMGTYLVTYSASDPDGVVGMSTRTVVVEDSLQCVPAFSNLIGWWTGNGTARDALGLHNGTLEGGVTYAPGLNGQAFSFDGASGYVNLGSWNAGSRWTIAAWVNPSSLPAGRHTIAGGVDNCADWAINLYNGQLGLDFLAPGTCSSNLVSPITIVPGTWYFVAGTCDGTTASLYVNGLLQEQGPVLGYFGDGTDIQIGGDICCGEHFPGLVNDVTIYNRALSPTEVANLYNAGDAGICTLNPAVLGFAPPSGAVGNAIQIIGSNFFGITNVTFNGTPAQYVNPSATEIDAYVPTGAASGPIEVDTYAGSSVSESNFVVTATNFCVPPPSGMIAWWPAQGNTLDVFGHTGIAGTGVSYGPGAAGEGFIFDGSTNAYIEVPAGDLNPGPGNGFTIEGWINPVSVAEPEPIIEWTHGGGLGPYLWISFQNGNGVGSLYGNYANGGFSSPAGVIRAGQWQHIAMTYDRTSGVSRLFVNGETVAEQYGGENYANTTFNLYLGADYFFGPRFFDGSMDELAMYNRGLSPEEIAGIYNAGSLGKCLIPPQIATQPASLAENETFNASLSVGAYGMPVLAYQWLRDNAPLSDNGHITGSTNATLNIQNVSGADTGSYTVVVTNYLGSITSAVAVLTVTNVPVILVKNITAPATSVSGQPMEVSWIVTNAGLAPFNGTFHDFVSLTSNYNGTDLGFYGTFTFAGTLQPGQSAALSGLITPNLLLSGNQWIFIQNDANSQVAGGVVVTNTFASASPADILPEPLPDLQVAYIDSPPSAFAGQSVTIQFDVTNTGTGSTTTSSWSDGVWLSPNGQAPFSATFLGLVPNVTYLTPGGSYVSTFTGTIPQQISGNYYFVVGADIYDQVTEYSHTNSTGVSAPILIEIPPLPDLVVPSVIAPPTTFSGQTLSLSWTVKNAGQGATGAYAWLDAVYLSPTNTTLNVNNSYLLGYSQHNGALASGGSYTVTNFAVTLPVGISGTYYLTIQVDPQNLVYALTHSNSVGFAPATSVLLTPPPDLAVEQVTAPSSALSSGFLTVTNIIGNIGAGDTPNWDWVDSYYLVTGTNSSLSNALYLGNLNRYPALEAGQSYTNIASFPLPNGLTGEYYVAVFTDSGNAVFELNKSNNIGFSPAPVDVQTVLPDLRVISVQAPSTAQPGGGYLMGWTVQNQGSGATLVNAWYDNLYITSNSDFANASQLASIYHVGGLNPGDLYTVSNAFVSIPYGYGAGSYQLFVVANSSDTIFEGSNSIHETSGLYPISLYLQTADLSAGVVTAPSTGITGQSAAFSWLVTNLGPGSTLAGSWNDAIYLSTNSPDEILTNPEPGPNDVLVAAKQHFGNVAPGGFYSNSADVTLPTNSAGVWNAYLVVDSTHQVREDTIRSDNVSVATNMIAISPAPPILLPDLLVSSVNVPDAAFSGQGLFVSWTVTNAGPGAAPGRWYDAVYLSLDQFLDRNTAVYLGDLPNRNGLTNGGSYTAEEFFSIPPGLGGLYYVFVVADAFDNTYSVSDTNEENEGFAAVAMQVSVPPVGDLQVSSVQVPFSSLVGQVAAFTYSVTNEGSSAAEGAWTDALYLSTNGQWSVNDPLVAEVPHAGTVPPGSNYVNFFEAVVPGVPPGNYYVIVRPDVFNNLNENGSLNHSGVSTNTFSVDVPVLNLGIPQTNSLSSGGQQYYKIYLSAGQTLSLSLTTGFSFNDNELFVSYGATPSQSSFDYLGNAPVSADQQITISATQSGWYYIMVLGDSVIDTETYSLQGNLLEFSVNSITPNHGGNAGSVTAEIQGGQFTPQTTASLIGPEGVVIPGVTRMLPNSTVLYSTFNLVGATPGPYWVRVQQPNGSFAQLANGFTVTAGVGGNLASHLTSPGIVRPGFFYTMTVTYGNIGDADIPAPLFTITNSENAPMTLSLSSPYSTSPAQLLGIAQNGGPAGVLPPDSQYTALVYFQVPPSAPLHTKMSFDIAHQMADTNAVAFGSIIDPLAPAGIGADAWAMVVANLEAQLGPDDAHYVQALDNDATFLSQEGRLIYSVGTLLNLELQKALNTTTPSHVIASSLDDFLPSQRLSMSFARSMPASIDRRFQIGPFGRGWVHNFEYTLTRSSLVSNVVDISPPVGIHRYFFQQPDGSWTGLPGDAGVLQGTGTGIYTLQEADGETSTYDSAGRLISVEDSDGNQILLTYSGGRLVGIIHSDGQQFTIAYNGSGCISSITDSAGQTTQYLYDAAGQHLTSVVGPGNVTISYSYVPATGTSSDHALASTTYPDGTHRYYAYDTLGRLSGSWLDGHAEQFALGYDPLGDIWQTNALGQVTTMRFDERGDPLVFTDAMGNTTICSYSSAFYLTQILQSEGQATGLNYDSDSRQTGALNAVGGQVALSYTALSRLGSLQDTLARTTTFSYDGRGDLTQITYPDQTAEIATFDSTGSLTNYIDRRGLTTRVARNFRGQPIQKILPGGRTINYAYDIRGLLTNVSDSAGGVTILSYDARGFLTNYAPPDGHAYSFTYDNAGHRTQRIGADGYILNYGYDAVGRLASVTDASDKTLVHYSYDSLGNLIKETNGNGVTTVYGYDSAQELVTLTNFAPDSEVISFFNYSYGANGECLTMTSTAGVTYYQYDALRQLTAVSYPDGRYVSYSYDGAGNRTTVVDSGTNFNYGINLANEYLSEGAVTLMYDADGNLTNRNDGVTTTTYEYDGENHLLSATNSSTGGYQCQYNAFGLRTSVIYNGVSNSYSLDPVFGDVAAEYDANGSLIAHYNQGLGLFSQTDPYGNASYYSYDAIGNTREITASNGGVLNNYDYDAYGADTTANETVSNEFQFGGRFGVSHTPENIDYMKNRYYSPELGRFQSDDPIRFGGGLNFSRYARNNPISYIDPLGLRDTTGYYQAHQQALQEDQNTSIDTVDISFGAAAGGGGVGGITVSRTQGIQVYGGVSTGEGVGGGVAFSTSGPTEGMNVAVTATAPGALLQASWAGPSAEDQAKEYIRTGGKSGLNGFSQEVGVYAGSPGVTVSTYYVSPPVQFDVSYAASYWYNNLIDAFSTRRLDDNQVSSSILAPGDPNDKTGPIGYGPNGLVSATEPLSYTITFVNAASNTAPAHTISITDQLDPNLDPASFRLTEIVFGTNSISVPPNRSFIQTNLSLTTDAGPLQVDVVAGVNVATSQLFWTLTSIDPATGQSPSDPELGLLPPDSTNGIGEGRVSYTVTPVENVESGTTVTNDATIVFDNNPPITTSVVTNTLDTGEPESQLTVQSTITTSNTFLVSWSGTDTDGLSGVAGFNIYVSEDGGPYQIWLQGTALTSAFYVGQLGHSYSFYSTAFDNAGNSQPVPASAQATVYVSNNHPPILAAISNYVINVGTDLFFTNNATDTNVPAETLTFGLLPGAPAGANVDPQSGVFSWIPAPAQAGTSNVIGIAVTNNGLPPLSASQTFTVLVNDYVAVNFGSPVAVLSGQTASIPVNLFSSAGLTNLSFSLNYPAGTLTNFSLSSLGSSVASAGVHIISPTNALLEFTNLEGSSFQGSQQLAMLQFTAIAGQPSGFVPLTVSAIAAVRTNSAVVADAVGIPETVNVVNQQPLLLAMPPMAGQIQLTLFASPGATYLLESTPSLRSPVNWQIVQTFMVSNLVQSLSLPAAGAGTNEIFYRLQRQ